MTNTRGKSVSSGMPLDHVSRAEFEQFERSIHGNFEEVRYAISQLSQKLDTQSSKGTDWKAIFAAMGVALSAVALIGAVISWSIIQHIDGKFQIGEQQISTQAALFDGKISQNQQRIIQIEDAIKSHTLDSWTGADHDRYTVPEINALKQLYKDLEIRVRATELDNAKFHNFLK